MTGFGVTAVLAALILAARCSPRREPDRQPVDRALLVSALPPVVSAALLLATLVDRLLTSLSW